MLNIFIKLTLKKKYGNAYGIAVYTRHVNIYNTLALLRVTCSCLELRGVGWSLMRRLWLSPPSLAMAEPEWSTACRVSVSRSLRRLKPLKRWEDSGVLVEGAGGAVHGRGWDEREVFNWVNSCCNQRGSIDPQTELGFWTWGGHWLGGREGCHMCWLGAWPYDADEGPG